MSCRSGRSPQFLSDSSITLQALRFHITIVTRQNHLHRQHRCSMYVCVSMSVASSITVSVCACVPEIRRQRHTAGDCGIYAACPRDLNWNLLPVHFFKKKQAWWKMPSLHPLPHLQPTCMCVLSVMRVHVTGVSIWLFPATLEQRSCLLVEISFILLSLSFFSLDL